MPGQVKPMRQVQLVRECVYDSVAFVRFDRAVASSIIFYAKKGAWEAVDEVHINLSKLTPNIVLGKTRPDWAS